MRRKSKIGNPHNSLQSLHEYEYDVVASVVVVDVLLARKYFVLYEYCAFKQKGSLRMTNASRLTA